MLLDLRRSRYLSLGASGARALSQRVIGWPSMEALNQLDATQPVDTTDRDQASTAALGAALRRLLELDLLTDVDEEAMSGPAEEASAPISLPQACRCLESEADFCEPRIRATDALRSLHAAVQAHWWLRKLSLERIAARVDARRGGAKAERATNSRTGLAGHRSGGGAGSEISSDAASLHIAALKFERLRPFALTARDQCLRDSLALMSFLASMGLRARWIIGVRTRPFGAHSWVQIGDLVLNDHHEHVRAYQPILVV